VKIFISADIEGVAGFAIREEGHKAEAVYQAMAQRMTREVVAACEAAHAAGAAEIVVKDGHGDATTSTRCRCRTM
jgi:D-amino peptidase